MKKYKLTITGKGTTAELVESLERVITRLQSRGLINDITVGTTQPTGMKYIIQEIGEVE